MIEVRLFGALRHRAGQATAPSGVVVELPPAESATVGQVLATLGIGPAEVGNLFLNGRLLPWLAGGRPAQAISLGYPLAVSAPLSLQASLDVSVEDGDRLGIFCRKMSLLVV